MLIFIFTLFNNFDKVIQDDLGISNYWNVYIYIFTYLCRINIYMDYFSIFSKF